MISALLDFILALTALWFAYTFRKKVVALSIAGGLLSIAAFLGALRFSTYWVNIPLHHLFSQLGAFVSFPLLANYVLNPSSFINKHQQFAFTAAFILGCLGVFLIAISPINLGVVIGSNTTFELNVGSLWGMIAPLISVTTITYIAWARGILMLKLSSSIFLITLVYTGLAPILAPQGIAPFQSMDVLHVGLSLGLISFALATRAIDTTTSSKIRGTF